MEMIYVFDRNEELKAILKQEEGFLSWVEAKIEEEINGKVSLDLSVPFYAQDMTCPDLQENHPDTRHIEVENTVVVKMIDTQRDEEYFREFVVKETETDTDSQLKIAYCTDSAIAELNDEKLEEKRPGYGTDGTSALFALEVALEGARWEVGHVDDLGASRAHFFHESRMSCIRKILESWGGEVRFRVEMSGNRVVGRYVDIFAERGEDRGKRIEIGKDLVAVNQSISTEELATAIWPRGKGEELEQDEGEEEDRDPAYGRRINIEEVEWKTELGDPVDKPKGQKWIGDPEALEEWGRIDPSGVLRHKMVDVVFEDIEEPEELIQAGWDLLQELKKPRVSIDVHMIDLEHQYGHEAVRLGDTVRLVVCTVDPVIRVMARVTKIVRYLGEPERTEVTVGNVEDAVVDVSREIRREVEEKFGKVEPITWRGSIFDLLNNEIVASNAYMYFNTDDGMVMYNRPRDQNPNEAMNLKAAGLRIADTRKPNGEFDWKTAITAKGISAAAITADQMDASRIGAGVLNIGGKNFGSAQLFFRDREDNIIGHFDGEARSWDQVKTGALFAPNVSRRTTPEDELSMTSLYVHPSLGDDVGGDGTQAKPYRTLQRALDHIPEENHATWDIRVIDAANNPISEHLEIRGYRGDGIIRFRMDGVKFTGWIRLSANLHRFAFYGGHYYHSGQGHPRTQEHPVATFHVIRTNILYMENCYISAEDKADCALSCTYNSVVEAYDSYFHRGTQHGIIAQRFGQVYISDCGGRNNAEWGAYARTGGVIGVSGEVDANNRIYCPAGKGGQSGSDDFFWYGTYTSQIRVPSSYEGKKRTGTRATIPANQILTAYATSVASWRMPGGDVDDGAPGWQVGKLYQGAGYYPQTLVEGKDGYGGSHVGFVWFSDVNFKTRLRGRKIKDVRVTVRRESRFSADTPKSLKCWLHNYQRREEAEDWDPVNVLIDGQEVGTYTWAEEKTFALPKLAGERLANGEAIGLAFFHEDFREGMEIIPRSVVIEVVYE